MGAERKNSRAEALFIPFCKIRGEDHSLWAARTWLKSCADLSILPESVERAARVIEHGHPISMGKGLPWECREFISCHWTRQVFSLR